MPPSDLPMSDKQMLSIRESGGARVSIWEGSVRSGKTIASLWRWMHYIAMTPTYRGDLLIIGRTRASVARNVFSSLQDPSLFGEASKHVHYVTGADKATILGRTVWVMGASDVKAMATLKGSTSSGAYVDEITVIPEDFFTILLQRLWGPAQLFGTTNPDNPAHWFKKKFLNRVGRAGAAGLRNWRTWHFVLDDNPALPEHQKESIRRENTGLFYRRYVLGEWVAAEGAIYEMWDEDAHVIPFDSLPEMDRLLCVGMDYGTTNAATGLMLGISSRAPDGVTRLYLIDEWRYDPADHQGRKLTDSELSDSFCLWLDRNDRPCVHGLRPEWIMVDPAAASFKVQLRADGLLNVGNAENNVAYGIRTVASLLSAGLLVVSDRCRGFINEIPGYVWDDKATEAGEDKPRKGNDHSLDAGRYAIASTETLWRGWITQPAA